ncbi:MAG: hypothetical protein ACREP9_14715 [Candidatus Dormibacteraceae bacterium]
MEIEFKPSQVPPARPSGPVSKRSAAGAADNAGSSQNLGVLKAKLAQLPLERPDKVAQAQSDATSSKYPPDDLLDRIAVLLAIRLGN